MAALTQRPSPRLFRPFRDPPSDFRGIEMSDVPTSGETPDDCRKSSTNK